MVNNTHTHTCALFINKITDWHFKHFLCHWEIDIYWKAHSSQEKKLLEIRSHLLVHFYFIEALFILVIKWDSVLVSKEVFTFYLVDTFCFCYISLYALKNVYLYSVVVGTFLFFSLLSGRISSHKDETGAVWYLQ